MNTIKIKTIILLVVLFYGCSSKTEHPEVAIEKNHNNSNFESNYPQTFIKELDYSNASFFNEVNFVGQLTLAEALKKVGPGLNLIPKDDSVYLFNKINIYANKMPINGYIEYIEGVTGYEIDVNGNNIEVASYLVKEWNVSPLSIHKKVSLKVGTTLDGSSKESSKLQDNKIESEYKEDDWKNLVKGIESILSVSHSNDESSMYVNNEKKKKPFIHAIQSMGMIIAGGDPNRMRMIDQFIGGMLKRSTQQINISVKAYDVSLSDKKSTGIDWEKLNYTIKQSQSEIILFDFSSKNNSIINSNTSLFKTGFTYNNQDLSAKPILNFLSTFGEVELINQPNVTVRNGSYAYIHTGDELGFVGEVSLVAPQNANPIQTPKIERLRVGVTLAVAPRILNDGRILLDIWPVISSLSGFDALTGVNLTAPRVALQELSTQVITRSSETVQLGGFIKKSIGKTLQDLPWKHKFTGKALRPLFKSESNNVEKRELVLMVTPTIVDSGIDEHGKN